MVESVAAGTARAGALTPAVSTLNAAQDFLALHDGEVGLGEVLGARLEAVGLTINQTGTYVHTPEELAFGARVAWRNNSRCIGRLYWETLKVRDRRHLQTADELPRTRDVWRGSRPGPPLPSCSGRYMGSGNDSRILGPFCWWFRIDRDRLAAAAGLTAGGGYVPLAGYSARQARAAASEQERELVDPKANFRERLVPNGTEEKVLVGGVDIAKAPLEWVS